jgi:hypothetical protein
MEGPPFDGKPCPFCPVEVRNLAAVAHNLLTVWDDPHRRFKLERRIQQLRDALKLVEPLSEAHFANRAHAHGDRPHPAVPAEPPR